MRLVTHDPERVADFVVSRLPGIDGLGRPFAAIGVEDGQGALTGGVVLNSFTGPDCELHIAGQGAVDRRVFRAITAWAFDQLGCRRITLHIRARDQRLIGFATRCLGFSIEGFHPSLYPDDDGLTLGLTQAARRW